MQMSGRDISCVYKNIFISDLKTAKNVEFLKRFKIDVLVNCSRHKILISDQLEGVKYIHLPFKDDPWADLYDKSYTFTELVHEDIDQNKNVLVNCRKGISRSVSLVISYFILKGVFIGVTTSRGAEYYHYCLNMIRQKRSIAQPNKGFAHQLIQLSDLKSWSPERHRTIRKTLNEEEIAYKVSVFTKDQFLKLYGIGALRKMKVDERDVEDFCQHLNIVTVNGFSVTKKDKLLPTKNERFDNNDYIRIHTCHHLLRKYPKTPDRGGFDNTFEVSSSSSSSSQEEEEGEEEGEGENVHKSKEVSSEIKYPYILTPLLGHYAQYPEFQSNFTKMESKMKTLIDHFVADEMWGDIPKFGTHGFNDKEIAFLVLHYCEEDERSLEKSFLTPEDKDFHLYIYMYYQREISRLRRKKKEFNRVKFNRIKNIEQKRERVEEDMRFLEQYWDEAEAPPAFTKNNCFFLFNKPSQTITDFNEEMDLMVIDFHSGNSVHTPQLKEVRFPEVRKKKKKKKKKKNRSVNFENSHFSSESNPEKKNNHLTFAIDGFDTTDIFSTAEHLFLAYFTIPPENVHLCTKLRCSKIIFVPHNNNNVIEILPSEHELKIIHLQKGSFLGFESSNHRFAFMVPETHISSLEGVGLCDIMIEFSTSTTKGENKEQHIIVVLKKKNALNFVPNSSDEEDEEEGEERYECSMIGYCGDFENELRRMEFFGFEDNPYSGILNGLIRREIENNNNEQSRLQPRQVEKDMETSMDEIELLLSKWYESEIWKSVVFRKSKHHLDLFKSTKDEILKLLKLFDLFAINIFRYYDSLKEQLSQLFSISQPENNKNQTNGKKEDDDNNNEVYFNGVRLFTLLRGFEELRIGILRVVMNNLKNFSFLVPQRYRIGTNWIKKHVLEEERWRRKLEDLIQSRYGTTNTSEIIGTQERSSFSWKKIMEENIHILRNWEDIKSEFLRILRKRYKYGSTEASSIRCEVIKSKDKALESFYLLRGHVDRGSSGSAIVEKKEDGTIVIRSMLSQSFRTRCSREARNEYYGVDFSCRKVQKFLERHEERFQKEIRRRDREEEM